jgi:amino acid transporter
VLVVVLAVHSHSDFVTAFNSYSGSHSAYHRILAVASSHSIPIGFSLGAAIAIIPLGVLQFNGVLYSYYVGGELRRPGRTYLIASIISIGVLVVLWVGVWALLRARAGLHFMQAQSNLGVSDPTAYAKITSLNSQAGGLGYGLVLAKSPITDILFGTLVPLGEIAVNLAFVLVTTRVLFAQAFDRLLPVRLAQVSEKTHGPTNAIAVVLAMSVGFAVLIGFVSLGTIAAQSSLFFGLILLAGGIAATALPISRPDLIPGAGMSGENRRRLLRTMIFTGALTTALALFMIVELAIHSNVYGKFTFSSITTLVVVLAAGPVVYAIVRARRKSTDSLDLSMAMRSLPPE